MCGIAGYLSRKPARGADILRQMADAIAHRGPDDSGFYVDDMGGVGLAHRRLSIVELSKEGSQPMLSRCGRYALVFNGEIYNHLTLRKALGMHVWRGHSDTETMLACFTRYGVRKTLSLLVGMFSFAVWDRERRELCLGRDRMGEKPLYYGALPSGEFVFGSELKALKAHPRWDGAIDREALTLFLRYNYIPAPWSVYQGIQKLRAGHCLTVTLDRVAEQEAYWDLVSVAKRGQAQQQRHLTDLEAIGELETLLGRVVDEQMIADVPLGAFLSGGVDSSTIVAMMCSAGMQKVRTFSIGFNEPGYDEAAHARAVAHHLQTDHSELHVTANDALSVVPRLASMYDEPFADSSQIPMYLVSALARRHVKVALSGDGGDELFAGYSRHRLAQNVWPRLERMPIRMRQWMAQRALAIPPKRWDSACHHFVRVIPRRWRVASVGGKVHKFASKVLPAASIGEMYRHLVSHWQNPSGLVLNAMEPNMPLQMGSLGGEIHDPVQLMCLIDQLTYLPDDILVKVDRASMAVSLETRAPLLDHRIVELAWATPMHRKIRGEDSKWLLRQVLYRHVPKSLIERPKQGFAIPLDHWLRGSLHDWASDLLSVERISREGYFDVRRVTEAWSEHKAGRTNRQDALWGVLTFQSWLENEERTWGDKSLCRRESG